MKSFWSRYATLSDLVILACGCRNFALVFQVNAVLSQKISGELDNQVKQQALFQLLGEDYVRIHFPHHKYNPGNYFTTRRQGLVFI